MSEVLELAKKAKAAARELAVAPTGLKNRALTAMADGLAGRRQAIIEANARDMEAARAKGTSETLLDRLMLSESRIDEMALGLRDIAAFPDPVGEVIKGWKVPNGLLIEQVRVPLGVVAMIYEARPNVTVDGAGLCLKSGNAIILRGGSMAAQSNLALTEICAEAVASVGLPKEAVQSLRDTSHEAAAELMRLEGYVDLLVPRGGPELIKNVVESARVPVLFAGAGNCHIYVDKDADLGMAHRIVINAKCQRPSVCNAAETLLVHENVVRAFLPRVLADLANHGVEIRGCPRTREIWPDARSATDEDYYTEFLGLIIAVRVVDSVDAAIDHINKYGTMHSEAIISENYSAAKAFVERVDAAAVYVNASTRFTDGGQFGLGAEIGISTQKLHARGPMGLAALTSTKYVVYGQGQVRE